MSWILLRHRTVSMRWFFWASQIYSLTDRDKKILKYGLGPGNVYQQFAGQHLYTIFRATEYIIVSKKFVAPASRRGFRICRGSQENTTEDISTIYIQFQA